MTNSDDLYFDYNANTPIDDEVASFMTKLMDEQLGNPSSGYGRGTRAKEILEEGRGRVARLIGAEPDEILFTSGGTESNHTVLHGLFHLNRLNRPHFVSSSIEHPAIIRPLQHLEHYGASFSLVNVDSDGLIDPKDIDQQIKSETVLISVMHANNEVGTIQPVAEISKIARRQKVLMHCDAAQSVGKVPVDVNELGVDYLSVAGHKLYAPEGIGALFVRRGVPFYPFMHGGGQEAGRRAGTENVLFAAALGKACEIASRDLDVQASRLLDLRGYMATSLKQKLRGKVRVNGHAAKVLPNTLHVSFIGHTGAELLEKIPRLCASTGAACHSGEVAMSSVLQAMEMNEDGARGAIRFSLGRYTTKADVEQVLSAIVAVVKDL